jgi:hypothetical protein
MKVEAYIDVDGGPNVRRTLSAPSISRIIDTVLAAKLTYTSENVKSVELTREEDA